MTKTITQDDVLRYIYKETSDKESVAIEKQLLVNTSLMDFYNRMKQTISAVNEFKLEPSKNVHDRIMAFSSSCKVEPIS